MQEPIPDPAPYQIEYERILSLFVKLRYNPVPLSEVLAELRAWFRAHFHIQELAMEAAGFPELGGHQEEHQALERLIGGGFGDELLSAADHAHLQTIIDRYQQAFVDHMIGADQAFHTFVEGIGRGPSTGSRVSRPRKVKAPVSVPPPPLDPGKAPRAPRASRKKAPEAQGAPGRAPKVPGKAPEVSKASRKRSAGDGDPPLADQAPPPPRGKKKAGSGTRKKA